jgi:hypothetical protein
MFLSTLLNGTLPGAPTSVSVRQLVAIDGPNEEDAKADCW